MHVSLFRFRFCDLSVFFRDSLFIKTEEVRLLSPSAAIMTKKALCVGCNYPGRVFKLGGAVNDAFWMATILKNCYQFDEIKILHDTHRNDSLSRNHEPATLSTHGNIYGTLEWLVADAEPGDVLVFFFSGSAAQVSSDS